MLDMSGLRAFLRNDHFRLTCLGLGCICTLWRSAVGQTSCGPASRNSSSTQLDDADFDCPRLHWVSSCPWTEMYGCTHSKLLRSSENE